jgi:hypothetical protein
MAVTAHFYNNFFTQLAAENINLTSDNLYLALVSSSYSPNQGTDTYWSTPQAYEITGTGYTTGGTAIGSIAVTTSGWDFSGANASWTSATFSAAYAVLYDKKSSAGTSPLIGYINFGGTESPSSSTFSITWNASGIGQITVS